MKIKKILGFAIAIALTLVAGYGLAIEIAIPTFIRIIVIGFIISGILFSILFLIMDDE